jgi:ATP-dependent Clp protease ATP-binding subunit ClpC
MTVSVKLQILITQPRRGHYEVSMPWVPSLEQPVTGASPSQLKEELIFRLIEHVQQRLTPAELDSLLPPQDLQLIRVFIEASRAGEGAQNPMHTLTWAVVGRWVGDNVWRAWIPSVPGTCLALMAPDDIYDAAQTWAQTWLDTSMANDLHPLDSDWPARIDEVEVELPFPGSTPQPGQPGYVRRPDTLQQVAHNLTHRAADNQLDPAHGRDAIVDALVEALSGPRPANICLVGPPGVGKTAIIHEAVRRIWARRQDTARRAFWETSGDRIIAGMSIIGQWEQRVSQLADELSERGDVLVIRELLGLISAGRTEQSESNVAQFLEPMLDQDRVCLIAEATDETFSLARQLAPGFVEKFRRVQVPELDHRHTLGVLTAWVREAEARQAAVRFTPDGIETILALTRRFARQEAFPGKAIRLARQCEVAAARQAVDLDEAGGVKLAVNASFVNDTFRKQTGLPRAVLEPAAGHTPEELRASFEARIFGQPDAVSLMTSLAVAIEQGMTDPERPLGSLLLIGPSGVGKTETAKALAHTLFGAEDRMIRLDMSEFNTPLAVSRLIGSASQPDGVLTSKVRLQSFGILLLDEIEKADAGVLDLLLQVLGDGRLTDAAGRTVDLRNMVIVMTSNLGAGTEDHWLGFKEVSAKNRHLHYRRAAEAFFRPEFFNRIDHVVPYNPLDRPALRRIARRTLQELLGRRGLRQAQAIVDVDTRLIDHLLDASMDPRYGARTLARRIEQRLITPLARRLIEPRTATSALLRVSLVPEGEDGVDLRLLPIEHAPAEEPTLLGEWLALGRQPTPPAEAVSDAMRWLDMQISALEALPEIVALEAEVAGLLEQFNAATQPAQDQSASLEALRQREGLTRRLEQVRARLESWRDAAGTFSLPGSTTRNPARLARTADAVRMLMGEVAWLRAQAQALSEPGPREATLVFEGLAGPFEPTLIWWRRLLLSLSAALELELTFKVKRGERWINTDQHEPSGEELTALSVSGEGLGLATLLRTLEGYTWSPRPASEGHHALVRATLVSPTDAESTASERIEFVETRGQIEDVRRRQRASVPGDQAEALRTLASQLVLGRLGQRRAVAPAQDEEETQ